MGQVKKKSINRRDFVITGGTIIAALSAGSSGVGYVLNRLNRLGDRPEEISFSKEEQADSTIFRMYPGLAQSIPWMPIGRFPTPLMELGSSLNLKHGRLWVKQDNLTSGQYGGNKVRKLEFLLADAKLRNRKTIITIGGLGSNHALATSIHGKALGFNVHLCLFNQPVTGYVRRNLMGFLAAGATIHHTDNMKEAYLYARKLIKRLEKEGHSPYFILSGGTCGLSNVGYVNAVMELAEQIRQGQIPLPDKIFVAAGTCGTISGMIAGLKIAGLHSTVMGVKVVDSFPAYPYIIRYYAQKVVDHLRKYEKDIPAVKIQKNDFDLLTTYLGEGYGAITVKGKQAVERTSQNLNLETTYTGKTMAACLDYIEQSGRNEKVLFWNTYNSASFPQATSTEGLPEEIVQQLYPLSL